jgi:hypothetical protein
MAVFSKGFVSKFRKFVKNIEILVSTKYFQSKYHKIPGDVFPDGFRRTAPIVALHFSFIPTKLPKSKSALR